jgi:predicted ATPase
MNHAQNTIIKRFIFTGTPGSGKTSVLQGLQDQGYEVIKESATDLISLLQSQGWPYPWEDPNFIDLLV